MNEDEDEEEISRECPTSIGIGTKDDEIAEKHDSDGNAGRPTSSKS